MIQAAVSLGEVVPEERCSFFIFELVFVLSVDETNSTGAVIFGSNVLMLVGPPESQTQITDLFLIERLAEVASFFACSN